MSHAPDSTAWQILREAGAVGSSDDDDDVTPLPASPLLAPVPHFHGRDSTSPIVRILEREIEPADIELARRLRAGTLAGDQSLMAARLIRALESERESSDSAMTTALGEALKSHDGELKAMRAVVQDLKGDASVARWIVRGILAMIGIFGLWGVDRILARTERDGEMTIRLQVIERTLDRLDGARERSHRSDWSPAPPSLSPPARAAERPDNQ